MATYEQVMEALRKADAEGNVEDAQALAQMASKMRPEGAGGGRGFMGGPTSEGKARAATGLGELLYESAKKQLHNQRLDLHQVVLCNKARLLVLFLLNLN